MNFQEDIILRVKLGLFVYKLFCRIGLFQIYFGFRSSFGHGFSYILMGYKPIIKSFKEKIIYY